MRQDYEVIVTFKNQPPQVYGADATGRVRVHYTVRATSFHAAVRAAMKRHPSAESAYCDEAGTIPSDAVNGG